MTTVYATLDSISLTLHCSSSAINSKMKKISGGDEVILSRFVSISNLPKNLGDLKSKLWSGDIGWGSETREMCIVSFDSRIYHGAIFLLESDALFVLDLIRESPSLSSNPTTKHSSSTSKSITNSSILHSTGAYSFQYSDILDLHKDLPHNLDSQRNDRKIHESIRLVLNKFDTVNDLKNNSNIRKSKQVLTIEVSETSCIPEKLTACWHASILAQSCRLPSMITSASLLVAESYYKEVLAAIVEEYNSESFDAIRLCSILYEFADEVRFDLVLKDLAFKSEEIILWCLKLCRRVAFGPILGLKKYQQEGTSRLLDRNIKILLSRSAREDGKHENIDSYQLALQDEALLILNSLKVAQASLKVLVDLFYGSESLSSRIYALSGSRGLHISIWLSFLVPDLFECFCKLLDVPKMTDYDAVKREFDATVDLIELQKLISRDKIASNPASVDTNSILNAVREKKLASESHEFSLMGLPELRLSIEDMQRIVLNYLMATVLSRDRSEKSSFDYYHVNGRIVAPSLPLDINIGDSFVRQVGWEDALENLVYRVSTLLDDMMEREQIMSSLSRHVRNFHNYIGFDSRKGNSPMRVSVPPSPSKVTFGTNKSFQSTSTESHRHFGKSPTTHFRQKFNATTTTNDDIDPRHSSFTTPATRHRPNYPTYFDFESRSSVKYSDCIAPSIKQFQSARQDVADNSSEVHFSELQTQESLLFIVCQLIRGLVSSSAKVRDVMKHDLSSYWAAILTVISIICPTYKQIAQELSMHAEQTTDVSKSASTKPSTLANIDKEDIGKKSIGHFNFLKKMSCRSSIQPTASSFKSVCTSEAPALLIEGSHRQEAGVIDPGIINKSSGILADFGAPRYGLSRATWMLLGLTRIAIEDIVTILDLNITIHDIKPPNKQDLRELAKIIVDSKPKTVDLPTPLSDNNSPIKDKGRVRDGGKEFQDQLDLTYSQSRNFIRFK